MTDTITNQIDSMAVYTSDDINFDYIESCFVQNRKLYVYFLMNNCGNWILNKKKYLDVISNFPQEELSVYVKQRLCPKMNCKMWFHLISKIDRLGNVLFHNSRPVKLDEIRLMNKLFDKRPINLTYES